MYYYTKKEFENYVKILTNSVDLKFTLLKENIILSPPKVNLLAETLLYNKDVLDEMTIDEIVKKESLIDEHSGKKLRDVITNELGRKTVKEYVYRAIIFASKYAGVKNFFYGQYRKFLPEYDYEQLVASKKERMFFEATMKELDRIDDVISSMSNAFDIDEIPYKYLEYIASLIGYESEDKDLVKDYVFRDLVKNMIEIYKIKGTNYSFELFLSFLGFDVEIQEYWFDRRYHFKKPEAINEYTKATKKDRKNSLFYLTPNNPETCIPSALTDSFVVFKNEIKGTMDLNMFNKYAKNGTYSIEQLLGFEPGFPDPYTYFKTNVVDFNFTSFKKEDEQEISEDDIKIINRIFEFLLPIFIKKQYVITINDWYENVNPDKELNEEWENSFFLFDDKHHLDKLISIDYEENKDFDPIYDETRRWDKERSVYHKGAIVIDDISKDYGFYSYVDLGDVVCYNRVYYIYIGDNKYMLDNPTINTDNYILVPSSNEQFEEWVSGMSLNRKDIVKYNDGLYICLSQIDASYIPPDQVSNLFYAIPEDVRAENFPTFYKSNFAIDAYNKYDYIKVSNEEEVYAYSQIDNNYYNYNIQEKWQWFNMVNDVKTWLTDEPNYLQPSSIYRYNENIYLYTGNNKNSTIIPPNDKDFSILTLKPNFQIEPMNEPDSGEEKIWTKISFNDNLPYFSVIDRVIMQENKSEEEALEKIEKMFDAVCVTSNKADWASLKNKYIYIDFYGNEHYEDGACPIDDTVVIFDGSQAELTTGQVLKYNDKYYYCYNSVIVDASEAIDLPQNVDPNLALITDNFAYSKYINTANAKDISVSIYPMNVNFGDILQYNGYFLCCYNKGIINNVSEIQDTINSNNNSYLALVEYNLASSNNPDFKYPILWNKYVPIKYKTIKIEFTGNNPTFSSVCDNIENKLKDYNIIDNDETVGKYVFERLDNYFKIYSKPEAEFEETPYIRIQYDFLKGVDPIPYINKSGEVITSLYGIDPNNAYYIFPSYFTSPRYRYDFSSPAITHQLYEFANRKNYIYEMYPSARFILGKILKRDVFDPYYEEGKVSEFAYKNYDDFDKEKVFPTLDLGFSFEDNKPICFEDYNINKVYDDYPISNIDAGSNKIYISIKKAPSSFYVGENISINLVSDTYNSYFLKTTIKNLDCYNDEYIEIETYDNLPDINLSYGVLRKYDEKIYNIEEVIEETNEKIIKIKIVDNSAQPFIVKPEEDYTVNTYNDLIKLTISDVNIVKVIEDETQFGKTTYYRYNTIDDGPIKTYNWYIIDYSCILVSVETTNNFIQKECNVISSEIEDGYNLIKIDYPDILEGFVSGKIKVINNIWHLRDYFVFMSEHLSSGITRYNFDNINITTSKHISIDHPISHININENKIYISADEIFITFNVGEKIYVSMISDLNSLCFLKLTVKSINTNNGYMEIETYEDLPDIVFVSGNIKKEQEDLLFDGTARF